jgi:hypothetical protein
MFLITSHCKLGEYKRFDRTYCLRFQNYLNAENYISHILIEQL